MPPYPNFIGGSYVSQSPVASNRRTVNMYVERQEVESQEQLVLYPSPGVTSLDQAVEAGGRAHFETVGREFCVIGPTFYEVDIDGLLTSRGTVAEDGNPATICGSGDIGDEVFITSGNNGYIFTLSTNGFATVRTGATTQGDYLDGFFLALDAATSILHISEFADGTTWDATQVVQRSDQSDSWIALKVLNQYIWLLGTDTSSVFYNAGTAPFPFKLHPSGRVPIGCAAAYSPEVVAGSLQWLAKTAEGTGTVVRTSGFAPDDVSTFALHIAIEGYSDIASAIGDTYEDEGHTFYLLTFPENKTWVYDATPRLQLPNALRWTERSTWIAESNTEVAWRPLFHAFAFGKHRMLDRTTGNIYNLSSEVLLDVDSRPLRRLLRPTMLPAGESLVRVAEFELLLETGLGTQTGQGSDPQVAMRISRDSGKTFGNERLRSAGKVGQYGHRAFWTRCGSAPKGKSWQPELVMTDPIPWRILGARVKVA